MGLNPATYDGSQDKNGDYVFDIQQDLEAMQGEPKRDHYWFGFESRRRNVQFVPGGPGGSTVFYEDHLPPVGPPYGIAHVAGDPSSYPLSHPNVALNKWNATYRVTLKTYIYKADGNKAVEFNVPDYVNPLGTGVKLDTSVLNKWVWQTFEISPLQAKTGFSFKVMDTFKADFEVLSIIEDGSIMDFDTSDKREGWRNFNTSQRADIVPDGTGANPDWALALRRWNGIPIAKDWGGGSDHLALVPGISYKICFKHRTYSGTSEGQIEASTDNAVLATQTFQSKGTWASTCLEPFVAQDHTRLLFGVRDAETSNTILIDDIEILK